MMFCSAISLGRIQTCPSVSDTQTFIHVPVDFSLDICTFEPTSLSQRAMCKILSHARPTQFLTGLLIYQRVCLVRKKKRTREPTASQGKRMPDCNRATRTDATGVGKAPNTE